MEVSSAPHSRSCSFKTRNRPSDLQIRKSRQRTNSVPNCQLFLKLPEDGFKNIPKAQLCRVRSFKTTSKHLINRGDSFKNRSTNSLMSSGSAVTEPDKKLRTLSVTSDDSQGGSSAPSYFKVAILGSNGVGKSTLLRQFMTSECMGYNASSPSYVLKVISPQLLTRLITIKPELTIQTQMLGAKKNMHKNQPGATPAIAA
ncbi:hypothetical protein LOTGIDRAFT_159044 [Lottia gigantea]|uniref:Uncharacterized protein n=1 Tax=Lottia gigantea TaxID=225164 RepID=V4C917_LOTGI|nr:hypothetical protein LOTGIDRAFT_159044 [Lottia gigantea]ESO98249.1 hypothetical protein LOTGIDRAFT_159044 [Lottia gigantea]